MAEPDENVQMIDQEEIEVEADHDDSVLNGSKFRKL